MLTRSGAKLLDFGLAKRQPADPFTGLSASAARSESLTEKGTIVGTLNYMAPEQVEGKEADARSDIFAFGAVLYEMVSGARAFDGDSTAAVIAAIMNADPPRVSSVQPMAPPPLDHVVRTCLEKDPDNRWQSAGDVARQLRWIREGPEQTASSTDTSRVKLRRQAMRWALAGSALGALVAAVVFWTSVPRGRPEPRLPTRFVIEPAGFPRFGWNLMAISPDGQTLVYSVFSGNDGRLYKRSMDQGDHTPITGTEVAGTERQLAGGPRELFFSPDGRWVGFLSRHELKRIPLAGGSAITLARLASPTVGVSWASDDTIVLGGNEAGILRVSASGGVPVPIVIPKAGELFRDPQILPGGKAVLFSVGREKPGAPLDVVRAGLGQWDLEMASLDTGERRMIVEGRAVARVS